MAKKKPAAKKSAAKKSAAKKTSARAEARGGSAVAKKTAARTATNKPESTRIAYQPREARALQRTARQSPYKMRLVIDQIRGQSVNDALALLAFSKKHAAKQIEKVVKSAVANAENAARSQNATLDVDDLFIKYAVINEGPKLKRWTPAAM